MPEPDEVPDLVCQRRLNIRGHTIRRRHRFAAARTLRDGKREGLLAREEWRRGIEIDLRANDLAGPRNEGHRGNGDGRTRVGGDGMNRFVPAIEQVGTSGIFGATGRICRSRHRAILRAPDHQVLVLIRPSIRGLALVHEGEIGSQRRGPRRKGGIHSAETGLPIDSRRAIPMHEKCQLAFWPKKTARFGVLVPWRPCVGTRRLRREHHDQQRQRTLHSSSTPFTKFFGATACPRRPAITRAYQALAPERRAARRRTMKI